MTDLTDQHYPCCTYVALVLHYCLTGDELAKPLFEPGKMTATRWGKYNIWDRNDAWSNVEQAAEDFDSEVEYSDAGEALRTTPGHWHMVQRWKHLDGDNTVSSASTGHTFFIWDDGTGYSVLESSVSKGFRKSIGYTPKSNYRYAVVRIPDDTPYAFENRAFTQQFGDTL